MKRLALLVLSLALAGGCGGDDDGDGGGGPDGGGGAIDAAGSENHLGETCSDADPCPDDHQCVYLEVGNPDLGYCSPICQGDADCREGYTGPASGMLSCFVPDQPDACTIVCQGPADCPGELTCVATGGPVSVCTTE